jgi:hypothetical protein
MKITKEQESFINNYVKALKENNAVIFAGAGMSTPTGLFDWKKLLKPIAERLNLNIDDEEHDLPALAQFFVDNQGGVRGELNQILIEQYGAIDLKTSVNHEILARLPIQIYWTTNYDKLIEDALIKQNKTPDVKKNQEDLAINFPKRDAIVYKMHGDINTVSETVLTKHEYEDYNQSRELFSNAFKSDFVSRTFLFIGFSFNDPNLEYLISRIRTTLGRNKKPDYFFLRKDKDPKKYNRQLVRANSLKLYGLIAIWIDEYSEITDILKEIEVRYLRNTVLISGSAEVYGDFNEERAGEFLHDLSKNISSKGNKILSGFGWGVGSAVINGVLENMTSERNQNLDNYLILRPFPQYQTGSKKLPELWIDYRENFIPLSGIAIFVFGNKKEKDTDKIIPANGMQQEFDIAVKNGLKLIPVGATGFLANDLWKQVYDKFEDYYPEHPELKIPFEKLGNDKLSNNELIEAILAIIQTLNKK